MTGKQHREFNKFDKFVERVLDRLVRENVIQPEHKNEIKSLDRITMNLILRFLEDSTAEETAISLLLNYTELTKEKFSFDKIPSFEKRKRNSFREPFYCSRYKSGYLGITNKRLLRTLPHDCRMLWLHADTNEKAIMQATIERYPDVRYKNGLFYYEAGDTLSTDCHRWTFGYFTLSKNDIILLGEKDENGIESVRGFFDFHRIISKIRHNPLTVAEIVNPAADSDGELESAQILESEYIS